MPLPQTKRANRQQRHARPALKGPAVQAVPVLRLSKRASIAFAEFLLNPPGPTPKAIEAAKRYKAKFPSND